MSFRLNYDKMIFLDAENLAEVGIKKAYDSLAPELAQYVSGVDVVQETVDNNMPAYSVRHRDMEYAIYSPTLPDEEGQSWGRAAYALFQTVNDQLAKSQYRLYAINGGNDLAGMFLAQAECEAARRSLARKADWPYLPTLEHSWYGQPHD